MAITREKKEQLINELKQLLSNHKLIVFAKYSGLNVSSMQELRKNASEGDVVIKVVKNRLFKVAAKQTDTLANTPLDELKGQLMYAISSTDEIAPAQVLSQFAKTHPSLEIVGGIDSEGNLMSAEQIKHLASLPSKEQLRAQLVSTVAAPLSGLVSVLNGNLRGLVNVIDARAKSLEA